MAIPPAPPSGMMGAAPPDPTMGAGADPDASSDETTVCTITKTADGTYMVYAGDEPEDDDTGGGDMSDDDAGAMGPAGDMPAAGGAPSPQGKPADSIGAALKEALTIMQADASSAGAPGSAEDQFAGGFGASKAPTPVGMGGA